MQYNSDRHKDLLSIYEVDMNNIKFECVAEMEKDVWPLQKKYLKEVHDFDWDYDELWYKTISSCY